MLEAAGGGMNVYDTRGLADLVTELFKNPGRMRSMGKNAKKAVLEHRAAADNHAAHIEKLATDQTRGRQ